MSRTKTQNFRVLTHLMQGKKIDPMKALRLFGVFRLSGRIFDIKPQLEKQGYKIARKLIVKGERRYAEYQLET